MLERITHQPPGILIYRGMIVLVFLSAGLALGGCGFYSFTGASIPAHLNDITIPLADDNSTGPVTTLGDDLTRLLIERFVGQTRLSLQPEEEESDVILTTRIDRYSNDPAAVSAQERASLNRVTIVVHARYFDQSQNEEILQRTFSSFAEYDPSTDGFEGELAAARIALTNIADDIFTAATSNW